MLCCGGQKKNEQVGTISDAAVPRGDRSESFIYSKNVLGTPLKCVSFSSSGQASVMVEYSYEEAIALLEKNLANALEKAVRAVSTFEVSAGFTFCEGFSLNDFFSNGSLLFYLSFLFTLVIFIRVVLAKNASS